MIIEFISPYAFDGFIGREYNRAINNLPADCWICLNDQDTLKPPGFADRVNKVLAAHLNPDIVLGCKTNRVGWRSPCVVPEMYSEKDISKHLDTAKRLWAENKTDLMEIDIVPGYCMVFHKSLWERMGGFAERSIVFDKELSRFADQCFIMQGVYIIHLYRWGEQNPELKTRHLTNPGQYLK